MPETVEICGTVAPGFEPVRAAFAANFRREAEIGAAVAVYHRGHPVVDLWAGVADRDTGRPWRSDTLTVAYSSTKSVPAACAHLLVQRGQLDLDAPVARYWPEFAAAGKARVPVRWLLSHQVGLPVLDRPLPLADALAWDPMVGALAAQAPLWEPGTAHGYHALTYGWLVGEVIRRVTGRSVGGYFATEIAAPLGLDFWLGLPAGHLPRTSRVVGWPTRPDGGGLDLDAAPAYLRRALAAITDPTSLPMRAMTVTTPPLDLNAPEVLTAEVPAVNGVGTARALARFYAGLIGEVDGVRVLDPATLAAATAEQAAGVDQVLAVPTRYALGFGLPTPDAVWWSPTAFGFPGLGGSLGYADPGTGTAFGYVANHLRGGLTPDRRAGSLVRAVRSALAARPRA